MAAKLFVICFVVALFAAEDFQKVNGQEWKSMPVLPASSIPALKQAAATWLMEQWKSG